MNRTNQDAQAALEFARAAEAELWHVTSQGLAPLGYDVVAVEVIASRQKKLSVYIDRTDGAGVGIEDCVLATKALDPVLDAAPEVAKVFKGAYELEVSSPGLERPLRRPVDFEKFQGKRARIHVLRPLTPEETGNAAYQARNPRQKNYLGFLAGFRGDSVLLRVVPDSGPAPSLKGRKPGKSARKAAAESVPAGEELRIPFALVGKAHLEPELDPDLDDERKK
ncbi:MAG: hypothetical protein IT285_08780 [Bdellovibrionales bacterium]|nr:hypothetical protein [Bdellovibrionales bacterium]